ncbi:MAG: hypothetical protein AUI14_11390 [Actinobacteria bacterium 13_2_20CM_2_71_6]|nr:MAG: hypothetical protein AUI14_11390 [Actinobacteria bacterium 13_2_20CM_2_71_6]
MVLGPGATTATGAGATTAAGLSDYTITVKDSGPADFVAEDERDAVRLARLCVRRLNRPYTRPGIGEPPKYEPDDLLGIGPAYPREILARVLDGSEFDEFRPRYGSTLVTGWGELHGYPVGVLAGRCGNAGQGSDAGDGGKAAQFIRHANATGTPLLFLENPVGGAGNPMGSAGNPMGSAGNPVGGAGNPMGGAGNPVGGAGNPVGGAIEPALVEAVATSAVPHLTVNLGTGSGMCGRAYQPRFLFAWPYPGALDLSGRLYDDGVLDPRDTRTALGIALAAVHSGQIGVTR